MVNMKNSTVHTNLKSNQCQMLILIYEMKAQKS